MKTPFRTLAFVFLFGCNAAQEPLPFESLQAVESSSQIEIQDSLKDVTELSKMSLPALREAVGKYFEGKEALRAEALVSSYRGDEKTRGPVAAIHGRILLELGRDVDAKRLLKSLEEPEKYSDAMFLTGLLSLKDASRSDISREEKQRAFIQAVSTLYQLGQQDQTYKDMIPPHTSIRDILWSLRAQGEKYAWKTSPIEIFETPEQLIALTRLLQTSQIKETVASILEKGNQRWSGNAEILQAMGELYLLNGRTNLSLEILEQLEPIADKEVDALFIYASAQVAAAIKKHKQPFVRLVKAYHALSLIEKRNAESVYLELIPKLRTTILTQVRTLDDQRGLDRLTKNEKLALRALKAALK